MGTVITFPVRRRDTIREASPDAQASATVVILPVIRIERHDSAAEDDHESPPVATGRRRRRRTS
ncbi:MAG TPA: hypothetical protein VNQ99_08345 [Xanthobacteraceae bacterium]|nr:hypothetical protein [Xanthobacteraceae bacterium]